MKFFIDTAISWRRTNKDESVIRGMGEAELFCDLPDSPVRRFSAEVIYHADI